MPFKKGAGGRVNVFEFNRLPEYLVVGGKYDVDENYIERKNKYKNIFDYDFIVIDECSMISKEMLSVIYKFSNKIKGKIIFLGDRCQLPPINEENSKVFSIISCHNLSDVVRCNSKLLPFCNYIRECIETNCNGLKIKQFKNLCKNNI